VHLAGYGLPMRGNSHLIICRYGSPLEGIRSIAFLAKGLACSSVCRLSFGSDIHSRMTFRRVSCSGFMLKILCSKLSVDGSILRQNQSEYRRRKSGCRFLALSVGSLRRSHTSGVGGMPMSRTLLNQ